MAAVERARGQDARDGAGEQDSEGAGGVSVRFAEKEPSRESGKGDEGAESSRSGEPAIEVIATAERVG